MIDLGELRKRAQYQQEAHDDDPDTFDPPDAVVQTILDAETREAWRDLNGDWVIKVADSGDYRAVEVKTDD